MKAYLSEIFSSVQGEGPYVGERHLFLRFCGCHRSCIFCDTPVEQTETVVLERESGSGSFKQLINPLTAKALAALVDELDPDHLNRRIALTGGAPLLQSIFLQTLLPLLEAQGRSIYLETAGDLPQQLKSIIEWVDIVAMDVKLESVTKEAHTFPTHAQFLKTCRDWNVEVFVKIVLSAETNAEELMQAMQMIKKVGGTDTIVVLQPMTRAEKTQAIPRAQQMLQWQTMALGVLSDVRVIPQTHKMMEML